jgi:hypothetical protein
MWGSPSGLASIGPLSMRVAVARERLGVDATSGHNPTRGAGRANRIARAKAARKFTHLSRVLPNARLISIRNLRRTVEAKPMRMTIQQLLGVLTVCSIAACGAELASSASRDSSSLDDGSSALGDDSSLLGDSLSLDGGSSDASVDAFASDSGEADSSPDSGEKAPPDSGFCSEQEGPVPSLIAGSVASILGNGQGVPPNGPHRSRSSRPRRRGARGQHGASLAPSRRDPHP